MIPAQFFIRLEIQGVEDATPRFRLRGNCRLCGQQVFSALIDVANKAAGISNADIALYYAGQHQKATAEHLEAHGLTLERGGIA